MSEADDLSGKYQRLLAEVAYLLDILEAREILNKGFIGMGKNIMQEKAGRYTSQIRRIRKLLEMP